MDFGPNDSLKNRAYGTKKDLAEKEDKILEMQSQNKQYYPREANGNVNEWGALLKQQQTLYQKEEQSRKEQEAERKREYLAELNRQRDEKQQKLISEQTTKRNEHYL